MHNIPIFISSDNNYAPQVAVAIASTCSNTQKICEFYILNNGINSENKNRINKLRQKFSNLSIEFIDIDLNKYFQKIQTTETFSSPVMFARFLIPILKPEINKAIYTDADVVVLNDIDEMFNEVLEDYPLGAVWEEFAENTLNIERKKRLNIDNNHKYFSSGQLLINCEKWRNEQITQKLIGLCNNTLELIYPDQDILNLYFQNNYKLLDKKYCYLTCYEKSSQPTIRHFTEYPKPWLADFYFVNNKPSPIYNREIFWKYAKITDFYDDLMEMRKSFLSQKFLYERYNAMVNKFDKVDYD